MQVLLDARPSITLGRQKRTRECYYLELFRGLLLKQREIGHAEYVFFLLIFLFFYQLFPTEKNGWVLLFGTVSRVPSAGNWLCNKCFFLFILQRILIPTENNVRVLLFGTVSQVSSAGNWPCKRCFFSFYLAKSPVSDRKELVSATIWNCFTCSFCGKLALQNIFVFLPFFLFSEKNVWVLLFAVARVPFETVGNWPWKICFFLSVSFYFYCKECFADRKERTSATIWNSCAGSFWNSGKFAMQNLFFFLLVLISEKNA